MEVCTLIVQSFNNGATQGEASGVALPRPRPADRRAAGRFSFIKSHCRLPDSPDETKEHVFCSFVLFAVNLPVSRAPGRGFSTKKVASEERFSMGHKVLPWPNSLFIRSYLLHHHKRHCIYQCLGGHPGARETPDFIHELGLVGCEYSHSEMEEDNLAMASAVGITGETQSFCLQPGFWLASQHHGSAQQRCADRACSHSYNQLAGIWDKSKVGQTEPQLDRVFTRSWWWWALPYSEDKKKDLCKARIRH